MMHNYMMHVSKLPLFVLFVRPLWGLTHIDFSCEFRNKRPVSSCWSEQTCKHSFGIFRQYALRVVLMIVPKLLPVAVRHEPKERA